MKHDKKIYWKLFTSTFSLSAFTFGGGYVIVPLMKKKFVEELHWIEDEEMLNLVAIAQSAPGVIAVNASIIIGHKVAGITGAFVTMVGTILPPLIIISIISLFYESFKSNVYANALLLAMQAAVGAVIVDVVINMALNIIKDKKILYVAIMLGAFIASYLFNVNVMIIILVCGFLGYFIHSYDQKKIIHGGKTI